MFITRVVSFSFLPPKPKMITHFSFPPLLKGDSAATALVAVSLLEEFLSKFCWVFGTSIGSSISGLFDPMPAESLLFTCWSLVLVGSFWGLSLKLSLLVFVRLGFTPLTLTEWTTRLWHLRLLLFDRNFPHTWHSTFSLTFPSFCWLGASWDRPVLVFWINHPPTVLEENFLSDRSIGILTSANAWRLEGGDTAGEVLLMAGSIGKLRFQRLSWIKQQVNNSMHCKHLTAHLNCGKLKSWLWGAGEPTNVHVLGAVPS